MTILRLNPLMFTALMSCAMGGVIGCRSPFYADKGAALGGLTGAGAGALIGENSGNPVAGALIGAAAGTLAGSAIGSHIDEDIARNNAVIEQRMGRRLAGAVSGPDVVAMTQAGLGEEVIIAHIQANGVAQPPQVNDLIALKNHGVSDRVINALQFTPPPQVPVYAPGPPRPVIVEEHYYGYDPWCRPHHHRHYPPPRVSFGFNFGRR